MLLRVAAVSLALLAAGACQPAVRDADRTRDVRDVPALTRQLAHPDAVVRFAAASTLCRRTDSAAATALIAASRDEAAVVRAIACAGLGVARDAAATAARHACLEDPDPSVRAAGLRALAAAGDHDAAATVRASLQDTDAGVVRSAAVASGRLADRAAVPTLLRLLDHPAPGVRSAAAWSLGVLGDHAAVGPLVRGLGDSDAAECAVLLDAVGRLGAVVAASAVAQVAATGHPSLAPQVPFVLARVSTPEGLAALLDNRAPAVRAAAALALGVAGVESLRARLVVALSDPAPTVREHAALGLGFLGASTEVDRLQAAAGGDPEPVVRDAAVLAVAMAGSPRATAASRLRDALEQPDADVRMRATELLGLLRAGDSVEALRAVAQHDVSDKVRAAARLWIDRIIDADV